MKQRILLLMMTALLSVGAWAQRLQTKELWTGNKTVTSSDPLTIAKSELQGARVGSQLTIYLSAFSGGNNLLYCDNPWRAGWANANQKSVSVILDSDFINGSGDISIHPQDQGITGTVTKVTLSYNGVNLITDADGWDPHYYGTLLSAESFTNASEGDILAVSIKSVLNSWKALRLQNATGNATHDTEIYKDEGALTDDGVTLAATYFTGTNEIVEGDIISFTGTEYDGDKHIYVYSNGSLLTDNSSNTIDLNVTSANIGTIKTNGVVVKGNAGTLSSVVKKSVITNYYNTSDLTGDKTLYITLTNDLVAYAKAGNLCLAGWEYTASSVDLIYKSDVNIASVSTGTVVADKTKALVGETVTLTVTPTANYQFGSLTVTDATGADVPTSGSGNTYTFTMPATAVTVDDPFTPTAPTALNTENIKLTHSVHSPEGDGTVKLWIHEDEENGWDFTIGRPVSSTEFAGVEVKYKEAKNLQMVITYEDDTSDTQSFSAAEGSTNTAYITFAAGKIVKSIKFRKPDHDQPGMIQFQTSSAVTLVGIVGASTYVPASSLTLTYGTLMDSGSSSVDYDNTESKQQFEIKSGWAGWIFTLPISTTLYNGINFNMTEIPTGATVKVDYETGAPQSVALTTGDNNVVFSGSGNITKIYFEVVGVYQMGTCTAKPAKYQVTVSAAKYATFGDLGSTDIIDYSSASGLKAYIAYVEDNKVKLEEVSKASANTAVILYADVAAATSYTVTTTNESVSTTTHTNELKISDGTVEGDESTIYVLANGDNGVGFYLVENGSAITAGKAYLSVPAGARQFIGFGDDNETTGIDSLTPALSKGEGVYYDLQGRRVAQPTKGLYIVNGKKVIII